MRAKDQPRSLRAARVLLSVFIVESLVDEELGSLIALPDDVLGADVLGFLIVPCDEVLGAVDDVLGDVVSVVLGGLVVGAAFGLGDVVIDGVPAEFGVELESVVCAYTRPATTANAVAVPMAMDLDLFMTRLLS